VSPAAFAVRRAAQFPELFCGSTVGIGAQHHFIPNEESTMSDPEDQPHPPAVRMLPVGPSHLNLNAAALSGSEGPASHSTALLLAGQSFLTASKNRHIPLKLRGELEEEGVRLIHAAITAAKRAS
jgi:hypothetical protein